jgi:hypothetical protein
LRREGEVAADKGRGYVGKGEGSGRADDEVSRNGNGWVCNIEDDSSIDDKVTAVDHGLQGCEDEVRSIVRD